MKLWKLMLLMLLATLTIYGALVYIFVKVADEVDNNGGLKSFVERIWEGNKK